MRTFSTEVRMGPDGRWSARLYLGTDRVTGRKVRPYRSWPGDLSREEAQAECDAWAATFAPGAAADASKRLDSMLDAYISDPVHGFSANTVATYRSALRSMVGPTLGRLPYDQVEPWDVQAAYRRLLDPPSGDGVSAKTLLKMHALLKGAYRSWRPALGRNIMLDVPAPVPEPREPFALDECDADGLAAALRGAMSSRAATGANISRRTEAMAAYIALNTGMRVGEVCGLRRCDWRRALHDLHVCGQAVERPELHRQAATKGKRSRNVSIGRRVERELERHIEWQDSWLDRRGPRSPVITFGPRGGIARPSTVTARFKSLVRELGLPEETVFHTLRHTHASWCLARGVDVVTLSERLGHASPAVTVRVYGHLMAGRDMAAARAFSDAMREENGCSI